MKLWIRISAFLIPYVAVVVGLYVFESAWLAILLYHAGIIFFLVKERSEISKKSVFSGWEIKTAIFSIITCSLAGLILYLLEHYLNILEIDPGSTLAEMGLKGTSWIVLCVYFVIVHPVLEEAFWRGLLR
ncbi:hypothetical protein KKB99_07145, partial [bacterium]|nr:hypothetical protein [bacterium]MBU1025767.1 hypothetical protein [bacterium]